MSPHRTTVYVSFPGEPARHLVSADGLQLALERLDLADEEGVLARPLGAVGRVVRPRLLHLIPVASGARYYSMSDCNGKN